MNGNMTSGGFAEGVPGKLDDSIAQSSSLGFAFSYIRPLPLRRHAEKVNEIGAAEPLYTPKP